MHNIWNNFCNFYNGILWNIAFSNRLKNNEKIGEIYGRISGRTWWNGYKWNYND